MSPHRVCWLARVYSARFVLEVLGAAGAIWGSSEAACLRRSTAVPFDDGDGGGKAELKDNNGVWRLVAVGFGVVFFIRFVKQISYDLSMLERRPRENCGVDCNHLKKSIASDDCETAERIYFCCPRTCVSTVHFFQEFFVRFVLHVLGGAGAIWGFSEACGLRRPETQSFWRFQALMIGVVFFYRFMVQMGEIFSRSFKREPTWLTEETRILYAPPSPLQLSSSYNTPPCHNHWFQAYAAKVVLEVLGAGGAVWGSSDVCLLRYSGTRIIWRSITIATAIIFFIRFVLQMRDYDDHVLSQEKSPSDVGPPQPSLAGVEVDMYSSVEGQKPLRLDQHEDGNTIDESFETIESTPFIS